MTSFVKSNLKTKLFEAFGIEKNLSYLFDSQVGKIQIKSPFQKSSSIVSWITRYIYQSDKRIF